MWRKPNLASALGIQKENWGVTMHFSGIIKLQFGRQHNTVLCILKLLTNILDQLSLNLNNKYIICYLNSLLPFHD